MANAEHRGLHDLFAAECDAHLAAMRAQLAVLASGADSALPDALRLAALDGLRDTLHTLAGAARSIELLDLEYLLRALEGLAGGVFDAGRLALFDAGADLAPQLLAPPGGRVRNQMMVLVARCAALSAADQRASAGALS